jgi:hypothetical protein
MNVLLLEVFHEERGQWLPVAEQRPGAPPGTLSDHTPQGRQLYLAVLAPDGSSAEVRQVAPGLDVEVGPGGVGRLVSGGEGTVLATLAPGASYERTVTTDRMPAPRRVRWRLQSVGRERDARPARRTEEAP